MQGIIEKTSQKLHLSAEADYEVSAAAWAAEGHSAGSLVEVRSM